MRKKGRPLLETGSNYCLCDFNWTWPLRLCLLKAPTQYKPALLISILALLLLLILNSTGTCACYVEGCIWTVLRKAQQQQVELESHSCAPVSLSSAPLITLHKDFQSLSCFTFAKETKIGLGYLLFKNLETSSQMLSETSNLKTSMLIALNIWTQRYLFLENLILWSFPSKSLLLDDFNIKFQRGAHYPAHPPSTITSAPASGLIFGDFLSKVFTL